MAMDVDNLVMSFPKSILLKVRLKSISALLVSGFVFLLSISAIADSELEIDVRGEFKATISDNVNLDNANKKRGTVLNFSPGLDIRYQSGRVNLAVDYWLDYYYFMYDKTKDARHSLFGTFDSEVIEDNLYVSARAGVMQQFLDRTQGFSNSDSNKSDNRRTIQNYNASAVWKSRFFDLANYEVGYQYGRVVSPADNIDDDTLTVNFSDTNSHNIYGKVSSGKRYQNIEWNLSGSAQQVQKSLLDPHFEEWNYAATVRLKFNRYVSATVGYGKRGNNAQTEKIKLDDSYMVYGFSFQPGPKLTISAEREKLPTRNYDSLSVNYLLTKRISMRVNYSVDFSSNSLGLAERLQRVRFEDNFGIDDGTGKPVDDSDIAFSLSDVDFENYSWTGSLTWRHKRDTVFFSADREYRIFDANINDSRSWGVGSGWKRTINKLTTVSANVSYRRNYIDAGARIDVYKSGGIDWQKTLTRSFKMALQYSHTQRTSTEVGSDLTENAITFYLRGTF